MALTRQNTRKEELWFSNKSYSNFSCKYNRKDGGRYLKSFTILVNSLLSKWSTMFNNTHTHTLYGRRSTTSLTLVGQLSIRREAMA